MRIATCLAALSIMTALAGTTSVAATATEPVADVTCSDVTLNAPGGSEPVINVPVSAQTLLQQCRSASGSQLQLLSPVDGFTAQLEEGTTWTQVFVVVNLKGEQDQAKAMVVRQ